MQPSAKIIKDSVNPYGDRLVTAELTFHRFVLAEFNTHRVFSRNSASSRAIPVEKQLSKIREFPAWPVEWPAEQSGMQGGSALEGEAYWDAVGLFEDAHAAIVELVEDYIDEHPEKSDRLHKSLVNRLLEPFMWHTVIVSSTDYGNYFKQRSSYHSPLAQPEIRVVSDLLFDAMADSQPDNIDVGQWHLPYILEDELDNEPEDLKKVSVARCARVSYLTHDGVRDMSKDIDLYEKLASARPPHASPLEHVATPSENNNSLEEGNFFGWKQLRHMVIN